MPLILSDTEITVISTILASVIALLGSVLIEWYKKRKTKKEELIIDRDSSADFAGKINKAALDNIQATQTIIDLLEERIQKERIYFTDLLDKSKADCLHQIEEMKVGYDSIIELLKSDNEALNIKINKYSKENLDLSVQVAKQETQITELKRRLSKYENGTTGDRKEDVKKVKETLKKSE
jgi:DNA-binding protein H-NS